MIHVDYLPMHSLHEVRQDLVRGSQPLSLKGRRTAQPEMETSPQVVSAPTHHLGEPQDTVSQIMLGVQCPFWCCGNHH